MSQPPGMAAHRAALEPGQLAQRLGPVSPPRPGSPKVRSVLASLRHRARTDGAELPTPEQEQNYAPIPANNDQKVVATIKPWSVH
jgi:hypothetical protein